MADLFETVPQNSSHLTFVRMGSGDRWENEA